MIIKSRRELLEKKLKKKGWDKWHHWFAWKPVELNDLSDREVWLGFCFRIGKVKEVKHVGLIRDRHSFEIVFQYSLDMQILNK
jgi:hypothetical protein